VINNFKIAVVRALLVLLFVQHGLVATSFAAPFSLGGPATEVAGHGCASMAAGEMGMTMSHDMQQHDHEECVDSGCGDCVGSVVCAPVSSTINASCGGSQEPLPGVAVAASVPQSESPYRPPILS
jgi:hypothetical protein